MVDFRRVVVMCGGLWTVGLCGFCGVLCTGSWIAGVGLWAVGEVLWVLGDGWWVVCLTVGDG